MFDLYTASVCITGLILIITVADVATNRLVTRGFKARTTATCLLITLATVGEWLGVVTNGSPTFPVGLHTAAKAMEFSLAPAIAVSAAIAYGQPRKPKLAVALAAAHGIFQWIAVVPGWVFTVDAGNVYQRQALYPLYVAAFLAALIYVIAAMIRGGKTYQSGMDPVLAWTILLLVLGIGIQFLWSGVRIDYLSIAIVNMLFCVRHYKNMLQTDSVTLLLNRRCYDVSLADMDSHAVVVLFDIDRFKQVNDTYGHLVGDTCLCAVAQAMRDVYGAYGLCYRIGGDEFCAIVHTDLEKLQELNRQFEAVIREHQKQDKTMPDVSLGYACYDAASCHIQNVIEEADAMLYRNKHP